MKNLIAAVLLIMCGSAQAATVTIDFEEFSVGDSGPLTSQGFYFTSAGPSGAYSDIALDVLSGSSQVYLGQMSTYPGDPTILVTDMYRTNGDAFSLLSADWFGREYYQNIPFDYDISVVGTLTNGDTVVANSAAELGQGDWLNIEKATFVLNLGHPHNADGTELYMELDNIVVGSAVPIPAAVWLFGSALGGLGWVRRRKTV